MGAREIQILAQPVANTRAGTITAPFQFLVDGADNLRVEGWNSAPGVVLTLTFRFAQPDGSIQVQEYSLPLTADRQSRTLDLALAPGYLINLAVFASGGTPKVGQTFVCIKLIRGFGGATIVMGLLLQGYVTAEQGLGWPGSPIADSISGGGVIRTIAGTDPAPGIEISETVPAGARWELLTLFYELVTNAVAANRFSALSLTLGGSQIALLVPAASQPAAQTMAYSWAQNLPRVVDAANSHMNNALAQPQVLLAGAVINSTTVGLQPGDDYRNVFLTVREWLEVDA